MRAVFGGSFVDFWDQQGLETEDRGNGFRFACGFGFQVVKVRTWK